MKLLLGLATMLLATVSALVANDVATDRRSLPELAFDALARLWTRANGCNANNCARAVTGTRAGKIPDVTSRQSDCSNFATASVLLDYSGVPYTTVISTAVPAYATDCSTPGSPASAFLSACSCWGFTTATATRTYPVCQAPAHTGLGYDCKDGLVGECGCTYDSAGVLTCIKSWGTPQGRCIQDADCPAGQFCFEEYCGILADDSSDCL